MEKEIKEKVFQALGEVSMCWSETPKGEFDSNNAERIGNELIESLQLHSNEESEYRCFEQRKVCAEIAKESRIDKIEFNMLNAPTPPTKPQ